MEESTLAPNLRPTQKLTPAGKAHENSVCACLHDLGVDDGIWNRTQKALRAKENIDNCIYAHSQNKIEKNKRKMQLNRGTIFPQALHKIGHRRTRKQRRDCPNSAIRNASLNYNETSVNIYQNGQSDLRYQELEKMGVELLTAGDSVNW